MMLTYGKTGGENGDSKFMMILGTIVVICMVGGDCRKQLWIKDFLGMFADKEFDNGDIANAKETCSYFHTVKNQVRYGYGGWQGYPQIIQKLIHL